MVTFYINSSSYISKKKENTSVKRKINYFIILRNNSNWRSRINDFFLFWFLRILAVIYGGKDIKDEIYSLNKALSAQYIIINYRHNFLILIFNYVKPLP